MSEIEKLYQERLSRIKKAIACEPVDRVPVIYQGEAFAPRYMGMTLAEYVNDPYAPQDMPIAAMEKLGDVDGVNMAMVTGKANAGQMGLQRRKMPGRELPDDTIWQAIETEVMTVEDYDTIIEIGWNAFMAEAASRITTDEEKAMARENRAWVSANSDQEIKKFRNRGFVIMAGPGPFTSVPMETFAGARSLPKLIVDFHRVPDKVIAASDRMMSETEQILSTPIDENDPRLGTWIGGWRGAPSFLSPKLFDRFFWPYFRTLVDWTVRRGLIAVLHLDHCWDRELKRLLELPANKCVLNPDGMTNLREFRKIVGDRMAVMGDVPSTLFSLGTPEEIDKYVRDLVNDIGREGLILAPGCDAPYNTKPENMEAFVKAAHRYGS